MHIDSNIIFIIVAAIVAISRIFARVSKKQTPPAASQSPERPRRTITTTYPTAAQTDDERVRKFLEALGAPPGAQPPPKIQPRTKGEETPPIPTRPFDQKVERAPAEKRKRSVWENPLPPLTTAPPPIVRQETRKPPRKSADTPPPTMSTDRPGGWLEEERIAKAAAQFQSATRELTRAEQPITGEPLWRQALRSPEALRSAFILREIFGRPRAFEK